MKKLKGLVGVLLVFMMFISVATVVSAQETTSRPAPTIIKLGIDNELFTIVEEVDKFSTGKNKKCNNSR